MPAIAPKPRPCSGSAPTAPAASPATQPLASAPDVDVPDHNAVLDPAEGQRKACAAIANPLMRPKWCAKYGIMTPTTPMQNPFVANHPGGFDPMRPVCQSEIAAARAPGGKPVSARCMPYLQETGP